MVDQELEQEVKESAEETSSVSEPVVPVPPKRNGPWRILVALLSVILCGALAAGGYLGVQVQRLQNQVEDLLDTTVAKRTVQKLATQYGLTTTFLQQIFPQEYVYVGRQGIGFAPFQEALQRHGYDWSGLGADSGRYSYTAPDGTQALAGVDVSTYNGDIDWEAVKADGISFAMIRLGFRGYGESGKLVLDNKFLQNIQGATQAGLDVGVYFFSQAITVEEAVEEAEFVLSALEGYSITYPVVFDLENIDYDTARTDNLTVETATQVTDAFCQRIEQAGYRPMIYGNVAWMMECIDMTQLTQYDRWLAQYQSPPTFPYQFHMWQYTHQGSVAGIEGNVDLNLLLTSWP